jgi:hypothetical protein
MVSYTKIKNKTALVFTQTEIPGTTQETLVSVCSEKIGRMTRARNQRWKSGCGTLILVDIFLSSVEQAIMVAR